MPAWLVPVLDIGIPIVVAIIIILYYKYRKDKQTSG